MKIAIIAWGSLVWDPRALQVKSDWNSNGPPLTIEFSRVSKDGRLTLVIDPDKGAEVTTYFSQSSRSDLGDAIADLRDREGTIRKRIGFVEAGNDNSSITEFSDQIDVFQNIKDWCKYSNFDAAVWTALPSQFKDKTNMEFSVENAIAYLAGLPKSVKSNALKYIRDAPKGIITPVKERIEEIDYSI